LAAVSAPAPVAACVVLIARLLNRESNIYQSCKHFHAQTGPQFLRRGTLYRKLLTFVKLLTERFTAIDPR
jgi:hypothetical protein